MPRGQQGGPAGSASPYSGTPHWEIGISAILHLCIFAVATRTFKSKYTNFTSLEMIKPNTF